MKTVRIYLAALAIVFSVGGAVASSFFPLITAYEWRDLQGTEDDACIPHSVNCQDDGTIACTVVVSGITKNLKKFNNVSTQCGPEMFKVTTP
jgi:hypothetical protein